MIEVFGVQVRLFREAKGLTLKQLEESSGVSRAMLSKVERGETQPTLPVAARIARALEVSLSTMLGATEASGNFAVVRRLERLVFADRERGFRRELLSPANDPSGVELARHELGGCASTGELPAYPSGTRKALLVETGEVEVAFGSNAVCLSVGDTLFFDADIPHRFTNGGKEPCSYLLIVISPFNARAR